MQTTDFSQKGAKSSYALSLVLRDPQTVQHCFMPGIKGGGILVETEHLLPMGAEILLMLTLPDHQPRVPITGKVIWITPANDRDGRHAAIGVQIQNDRTGLLNRIHAILSDVPEAVADVPTF